MWTTWSSGHVMRKWIFQHFSSISFVLSVMMRSFSFIHEDLQLYDLHLLCVVKDNLYLSLLFLYRVFVVVVCISNKRVYAVFDHVWCVFYTDIGHRAVNDFMIAFFLVMFQMSCCSGEKKVLFWYNLRSRRVFKFQISVCEWPPTKCIATL